MGDSEIMERNSSQSMPPTERHRHSQASQEGENPGLYRSSSITEADLTDPKEMEIIRRNMSSRRSIFTDDEYSTPEVDARKSRSSRVGSEALSEKSVSESSTASTLSNASTSIPPPSPLLQAGILESPVPSHLSRKKSVKDRYRPDGSFRTKFGDVKFCTTESIFDREVKWGTSFFGIWVAFWFSVTFNVLQTLISYYSEHGALWKSAVAKTMMQDLWKIAGTDLWMYLASYMPFAVHVLVKQGYMKWRPVGITIQSVYEAIFFLFFLWFSKESDYPWIGRIFLMLHSTVLLMKMHSYAFYNGYLWDRLEERNLSLKYLKEQGSAIDDTEVEQALQHSLDFCEFELKPRDKNLPAFPGNITVNDYFMFSSFPTIVYETTYPRTEKIRWKYLVPKILGIFGIIFVMVAIAQSFMYPLVMECLELQKTQPLLERCKVYPLILLKTITPFLSLYLLTFFLIWDLILNALAELTKFGDRDFYHHWWNCTDWDQYSRDWNVPVHKFLLRHVYHSSMSAFHVSKSTATFITFSLSSVMHEIAMYVIFGKPRFYLLMLQMFQLPLIALCQTKFLKDRPVLGNCFFWFGIVFGPSMMCTMYLVF